LGKKQVTIRDIAKIAGVSEATVSVAINGKPGVSDSVREKIIKIAKKINYQPNEVARQLITRKAKTIGMIVKDIANPFYSEITHAIEDYIYKKGYSLLLVSSNELHDKEVGAVNLLRRKQVSGLIIVPLLYNVNLDHIKMLSDIGLPHVLISPPVKEIRSNYIYNDDLGGAKEATKHLINKGYKKIGFACGPNTSISSKMRLDGYKEALIESGLEVNNSTIFLCGATIKSGISLTNKILNNKNIKIDALICYNDLVAIGVLVELRRFNYHVPKDLAVVGFDNIEVTEVLNPSLTTVNIPKYEIGLQAIKLLFNIIESKENRYNQIVLPTKLVIRDST